MKIDVLIAGGGPAGLSAALLLGRCHRSVLLCDEGNPRNRWSRAIHGLLGHEGVAPSVFLETAHGNLQSYPSVSRNHSGVTAIRALGDGFEFTTADGRQGSAAKVLLATGIVDQLPDIAGIKDFYGISVHHCLYCDGFEYREKRAVAYGKGDKGADLGIMMQHWIPDVVVCSDGTEISDSAGQKLQARGIAIRREPIESLLGADKLLRAVRFESGSDLPSDAMFFATGSHQGSPLAQHLGCARDEKGGVITDPATEETSVPGVYVAGDVSRDVLMVAIAIAEGAKAGVAINKALLRQGGYCE